ncbi:mercury(II) reductase [Minwuia sp.]|uniref:mercury(II) reductase n=1 Tax=Minwuia sp. TaxID=2493630 RepID=UPI003A90A265
MNKVLSSKLVEPINTEYDLLVIGAGSAGFSAAITAAEAGARVALVGHGTVGGTCVNVGCVPSKTLIRAMESVHNGGVGRFSGIEGKASVRDWAAIIAEKDGLVESLRQSKYADLLPEYEGITYIEGRAHIVGGGVDVDGLRLNASKIIVATGARPLIPDIPGLDTVPYLTSTTAFELTNLPESLLVVGGGYIGVEIAQMFARAGVQVTIVCRSRILPEAEPEIGEALTGYLRDEDLTILTGVEYQDISALEDHVRLRTTVDGNETDLQGERVLIATGRQPNSDGMGLEEQGVTLDHRGGIVVDDQMQSSIAGIFAVGDVTGRDQFVYMAAYGAKLAARNAIKSAEQHYDASVMPSVVFTDPQVASVGLTEKAAASSGFEVRTSVLPLEHVPRALTARDTRGLIKLVADADTNRILGAHILAPEGGESIQTAALAIQHGMTVSALADTIFPYLTTVEGLKLAAQTFDKDVAKLSCCAG